MEQVSPELLKILVCPKCHSPVKPQGKDRLVCSNPKCRLSYPVRDGIPVMLIEEAETD